MLLWNSSHCASFWIKGRILTPLARMNWTTWARTNDFSEPLGVRW